MISVSTLFLTLPFVAAKNGLDIDTAYEMKGHLAQIDAKQMYLHNDASPCKKLPIRSSCSHREIKRRTISLVGFSSVTLLLTTSAFYRDRIRMKLVFAFVRRSRGFNPKKLTDAVMPAVRSSEMAAIASSPNCRSSIRSRSTPMER
jgi:hypothetical protein